MLDWNDSLLFIIQEGLVRLFRVADLRMNNDSYDDSSRSLNLDWQWTNCQQKIEQNKKTGGV